MLGVLGVFWVLGMVLVVVEVVPIVVEGLGVWWRKVRGG